MTKVTSSVGSEPMAMSFHTSAPGGASHLSPANAFEAAIVRASSYAVRDADTRLHAGIVSPGPTAITEAERLAKCNRWLGAALDAEGAVMLDVLVPHAASMRAVIATAVSLVATHIFGRTGSRRQGS